MARPTYPRAGEPLPAALPPAERTVGQLVAESIRFYGDHFRRSLLLGIAPAVLVVPVLVLDDIGPRAALARAWRLARADYVHALGSLATLAIVVLLTQGMLAFLLRGSGGAALSTAFFLANVVISPLLFIGSALLYVDQAARVE